MTRSKISASELEGDGDDVEITLPHLWTPRHYQLPAWRALENGAQRVLLLWHRRAGKDSVSLNWTVRSAFQRVGTYWHVFPTYNQGKKALWNGMTREGRRYLSYWPKELIKRGPIEDEMLIELVNGSIWQVVGTDNIDRLVGSNPVGVVMSEYALCDPRAWDMLRPILSENGGWAIFPYTARGRNHGYDLYQNSLILQDKHPKRWFSQILTVDDTWRIDENGQRVPVVTAEQIEEDRMSGMANELIQQEYWNSFDAPLVGAYYSEQITTADNQGRIGEVPWDPRYPVYTWWDIGVKDATSIWFVQYMGMKLNFIDYYEKTGMGLDHFAKVLEAKPYAYRAHIGPHDLMKTEFGTGKKIIEQARALGIRFVVAKKLLVEEGIQATRAMLARCWFDRKNCARGLQALREYRKEYDEDLKIYANKPLHDWTSHAADAIRTGAIALREDRAAPTQAVAISEWDVYTPRQLDAESEYNPFSPIER